MRHPADGTLRRLLDEPDGVADVDRDHVDACPECRSRMSAASEDALFAGSALAFDVPDLDVDGGWRKLSGSLTEAPKPAPTRKRIGLRSPVVAAVGVVALLGGASAAAAGDWFPIFKTEKVAPITVPQADLVQLPELEDFGTMTRDARPNVRTVDEARDAREITGLASPRINNLPDGVTGQPRFLVGDKLTGTFTFDRARTEKTLGQPVPQPPAGMETSQFRMTAGPGLAAVWPGASGAPALVIGRVVAPKAFSSGVPFETARDYLLSLPGLPTSVAGQLKTFTKDGGTLPLIVKAGSETSFTTTVNGKPATVLTTEGGAISAVVWVDGGFINGVGGSLSAAEVLRVAAETQWAK